MIRFSKEALEGATQDGPQACLAIEITSLDRDRDATNGAVFAYEFSSTATGIADGRAKRVFEDNPFIICFAGPRDGQAASELGGICCIENSSQTEFGIDIEVVAAGILPAIEAMMPHPKAGAGDIEPFATLSLWFPLHAEDGPGGENLIRNMLDGPPRPLVRVELSDPPQSDRS